MVHDDAECNNQGQIHANSTYGTMKTIEHTTEPPNLIVKDFPCVMHGTGKLHDVDHTCSGAPLPMKKAETHDMMHAIRFGTD